MIRSLWPASRTGLVLDLGSHTLIDPSDAIAARAVHVVRSAGDGRTEGMVAGNTVLFTRGNSDFEPDLEGYASFGFDRHLTLELPG